MRSGFTLGLLRSCQGLVRGLIYISAKGDPGVEDEGTGEGEGEGGADERADPTPPCARDAT